MAITKKSTVKLNTGAEMPVVGLGTWKSQPGAVEHAVEYALKDAGYLHIDTATAYGNEKEVGEGIKKSGIDRKTIFVTTKLNNDDHDKVQDALEYSLKQLGTEYIDLWLMHWPAPMKAGCNEGEKNETIDWLNTWKEMERVYKAHPQKVKAIGVSNFSVKYLNRLLEDKETTVPAVNQIELHPSLPQTEIVKACEERGIVLTSYSPLGSDKSPLHDDPVVTKIAKKYGIDSAAVLVSFQAAHPKRTVLPKSVTPKRIASNAEIVNLTEEEVKEIASIGETKQKFRVCKPSWTGYEDNLGFDLTGEA